MPSNDDLEHDTRLAQGEGEVVVREGDVLDLLAVAVDDGGHEARAAGAAGRTLAEVRTRLSRDADLGHWYLHLSFAGCTREMRSTQGFVAGEATCNVGCRASRRGRSAPRQKKMRARSNRAVRVDHDTLALRPAHPRRGASGV